MILAIWAQSKNNAIGVDKHLPWSLPDDLKFFRQQTLNKAVVMGRKTFESFGSRPLPKRLNIILTSKQNYQNSDPQVKIVHSPQEAIKLAELNHLDLAVIGGASVYKSFMHLTDKLLVTVVNANIKGDTFAPEIVDSDFRLTATIHHDQDLKHAYSFDFLAYERKNKVDKV